MAAEADIRTSMARSPVYQQMGLRLVSATEGRVVMTLDCDERHTNVDGAVHGGVLAFLADTAMGFAVRTQVDPSWPNKTLSLSIDYMKGAIRGDQVVASARVDQSTKRFRWASVELTTAAGVVAQARSLNLTEPPR